MLTSKSNLYKGEWLELVFKNRNQQYGAYQLRSSYNEVLAKSMAAVFMFIMLTAVIATIIAHQRPAAILHQPFVEVQTVKYSEIYDMPKAKVPVKPKTSAKLPQAPKATPQQSTQNINYVPKPDAEVLKDPEPIKENVAIGAQDVIVKNSYGNQNTMSQETAGTGQAGDDPSGTEVHNFGEGLQVLPEPVGGDVAWNKFLQKNLRYPGAAQDQGVAGKVFMTFIIEKDGSLSDITVLRKAGFGFDEESMRVLKLAKKWKPGMQNGQPVRVRYTLPINFQLGEPQ